LFAQDGLTLDTTSFTVITILAVAVQLSVAVNVPSTVAGICDTQDTVTSVGKLPVNTGLTVSATVMVCTCIVTLPHSSVAVQVRVTVKLLAQLPAVVVSAKATVAVPQLSIA